MDAGCVGAACLTRQGQKGKWLPYSFIPSLPFTGQVKKKQTMTSHHRVRLGLELGPFFSRDSTFFLIVGCPSLVINSFTHKHLWHCLVHVGVRIVTESLPNARELPVGTETTLLAGMQTDVLLSRTYAGLGLGLCYRLAALQTYLWYCSVNTLKV